MNAARSSSAEAKDRRIVVEAVHVGSLALTEATWLQALLAGPAWPSGLLIGGLVLVQLMAWWVARCSGTAEAGRTRRLVVCLLTVGLFASLRIPAGGWAAALGLLAAIIMAVRGIGAATDRPDSVTAFRRVAAAFICIAVALYVHRLPQGPATAMVIGQLLVCGVALASARWLEMASRPSAVGGATIMRASGQLIAIALALVAGLTAILTPRVLAAVVLRPLGWLADAFGRLVSWALMPVGRLLEAIILGLRAHASPQVVDIMDRMLSANPEADQPGPNGPAVSASVTRFLSVALLAILAFVAYRVLSAALSRRRAALNVTGGTVTVTNLAAGATKRRDVRQVRRRAAPEPLDGSAAGQVRLIYRNALRDAGQAGIARRPEETPGAYAGRLVAAGAAADDVHVLTGAYEEVRYGSRSPATTEVNAARQAAERVSVAVTAASTGKK